MNHKITFLLALLSWTMCLGVAPAQEIGFVEEFALAKERQAVLARLVPGTDEYYYYHALHYQNENRLAEVDKLLNEWINRLGRTSWAQQIELRQALLAYETDPQRTLNYLQQHLGLRFDHQREIPDAERDLPSRLDQDQVNFEAFARRALGQSRHTDGFEDSGLFKLSQMELDNDRLRHLLQRLRYPDVPGVVGLILRELQLRDAQPFGSMSIHRALTLQQLDDLARQMPSLLQQREFVTTYLSKLSPSDDANWIADDQVQLAYLERVWEFASGLDPVFNSLKANILLQRLVLDRKMGVFDKQRFLAYLQLPRQVSYIRRELLQGVRNSAHYVDFNADYRSMSCLLPITNDEPLVRYFLLHYLRDAANREEFAHLIDDQYLRNAFAESKITSGQGDPQQWSNLLSPEQYRDLMQRVDLDFAPTLPTQFGLDDVVRIKLTTKNVPHLIVKVFEINTEAFYRQQLREIDTDINIDGLIPHWEQSFQYEDAPLLRVEREFSFDQLQGPGVWVIDFIGNGKSSRALIRKGELSYTVETTLAGQAFTIHDQTGARVHDAKLWIAGRDYDPIETGEVVVPFSTQPGRQAVVISRGSFSALGWFEHEGESYQLQAGFFVDRESLIRGRTATVLTRPALYLNGMPIPNDLLKELKFSILAIDQDGLPTRIEVPDFALNQNQEAEYEFQVPAGLKTLQFALQAKVPSVTQGEDQALSAGREFSINQIESEANIRDVHLMPSAEGYRLEVRGKTGEAIGRQVVQLSIKHRMFQQAYTVALQADAQGRIELGPLTDIQQLNVGGSGLPSQNWTLDRQHRVQYQSRHGQAGESIEVPFKSGDSELTRDEVALFEMRGGTIVADRWENIVRKPGSLLIDSLEAGDYELMLKESGQTIRLRLVAGENDGALVVGQNRVVEQRGTHPLRIASIAANNESLVIQLGGNLSGARVHVSATRYFPRFDVFQSMAEVRDAEPLWSRNGWLRSAYLAGRDIGDEYRYILDRKYAAKFPGNMLQRPSLLLQPWARQTTENTVQRPNAGGEFGAADQGGASGAGRNQATHGGSGSQNDYASLDFLYDGAVTLWNLTPNEEGQLIIANDLLDDRQFLSIVAVNDYGTVREEWRRATQESQLRDLRLASGLESDSHATLMKQFRVLKAGDTLQMNDLRSARFQMFATLGDAYRLFQALSKDPTLAEFRFILDWPNKTREEKLKLYTKYACHELNFFIYHKDREFFQQVVLPYLANKRETTFVDHYLSSADVSGHLDPWLFQRMNLAEKLLLAQRVPNERDALIRHARELYQLNPTSRATFDVLFNIALNTTTLSADADDLAMQLNFQSDVALAENGGFRQLGRGGGAIAGGGGGGFGGNAPGAPPPAAAAEGGEAVAERRRDAANQLESRSKSLEKQMLAYEAKNESGFDRLEADARKSADPNASAEYFFEADAERLSRLGALRETREALEQLYRRLPPTEEWVEMHYYRVPIEEVLAGRISINQFWRDYAEHLADDAGPFLSPYFPEAADNFSEMMFALAVLDLPFESAKHEVKVGDDELNVTAAGDLIAFYQQVQPAELDPQGAGVLISENFFRQDDRYRQVGDQRFDKFVADEFLVRVLYGAQVVLTNPTSTPQLVDLLVQIPVGAMPALGSQATRTRQLELAPFSTQTFEYYFYFPESGEYDHFPAHVSIEQRVVASAENLAFRVVDVPSNVDRRSWAYVSQQGSADEVIHYLQTENVLGIDLSKIAFRMGDAAFFQRAIETLKVRKAYHGTLWSYSVRHNQPELIGEFLRNLDSFLRGCGFYLDCQLLRIDPVDRRWYEHREYWPLVNARAHQLGQARQITNARILQQYQALLNALACRAQLGDSERLAVVYYLLLQDRVEEAIEQFTAIQRENLVEQLQYDYLNAYMALYREAVDEADAIAEKYIDHPVERWRNLFRDVREHVAEIRGEPTAALREERDRQRQQQEAAAKAPSLDFKVESRRIEIDHRNLTEVEIRFYQMDLELLFSRNPFVQQATGGFSLIRPNHQQTVKLAAEQNRTVVELPESLHNANVLIEISGAGLVKSQAYYAHSLVVEMQENYGQLRVISAKNDQPLAKVYVKVFARKLDGSVEFYKDGYTDLRGRFDYAAMSNQRLEEFSRFAILILSENDGAVVREAAMPKE